MKLNSLLRGSMGLLAAASFLLVFTSCQAQQADSAEETGKADTETATKPAMQTAPQQAPAKGGAQTGSIVNVSTDKLEALVAETPDIQILDVRTPEEVSQGVMADAQWVNVFDADFTDQVGQKIDKDKPVLVYCKAGGRSARAASMLQQQGYTRIYNYSNGMDGWKAAGKPTVKLD